MPNNLLRQPNFAALVALVWLLVALGAAAAVLGADRPTTLFDTDDAMRLAQMRDWLAGQSWFDLHQARMQPPGATTPLVANLIDAGLTGLRCCRSVHRRRFGRAGYFPVEHHTAIPLLHFWKRGFELACKCLGKEAWADESEFDSDVVAATFAGWRPRERSRSSATPASGWGGSAPTCFCSLTTRVAGRAGPWPGAGGRVSLDPTRPGIATGGPSSPCGARAPSYMSQDAAHAAKR